MYPVTADHLKQFLMQDLLLCQTLDDFEYRALPGLYQQQVSVTVHQVDHEVA